MDCQNLNYYRSCYRLLTKATFEAIHATSVRGYYHLVKWVMYFDRICNLLSIFSCNMFPAVTVHWVLAPKLKDQNRWFRCKDWFHFDTRGWPNFVSKSMIIYKQVVINTRRNKKRTWGLAFIGISLDFAGAGSIIFSFFLPFFLYMLKVFFSFM